jgi:dipeptidyl aminopeptidase/acylaminoacyl peptidase
MKLISKNGLKFACRLIAACVCAIVAMRGGRAAQKVESLPVEVALNMQYFAEYSPLAVTPDGQTLAYVIRNNQDNKDDWGERARTGIPWHARRGDIWILNIETGEKMNLTDGRANNWLPAWSPDGRLLAFFSDRDGSGQARVWIWDPTKNQLRVLSDINVRGDQIEWLPNGETLFVTTVPRGLSSEGYAKILSSGKTQANNYDVRKTPGSSVILYRGTSKNQETQTSDPWNLDFYLRDLASIEVSTGRTTWIIHGQRIAKYLLSPDGSRVAYSRPNSFEMAGSQQTLFDIVSTDILGRSERILTSNIRLDYDGTAFSWSPRGSHLSFQTGGPAEKTHDCYVVHFRTGQMDNLTHLQPQRSWERKGEPPLWDAKGENVYFINDGALWRASLEGRSAMRIGQIPNRKVQLMTSYLNNQLWTSDKGKSTIVVTHDNHGKQDGFYKIALDTGEHTELLEEGQCYTCNRHDHIVGIGESGQQIAYFAEDAGSSPDIWISSPNLGNRRRLTDINPQFDRYEMGLTRLVRWLSTDGEELQGALVLPPDFREGRRYPLIVWVYGGAILSDHLDHFGLAGTGPFNLQLLATRGYAILLPDAPQHPGTPMLDLAKTILPGVDKVISMGVADPDRLGVMGHSYGGYSVLSLIVQTRRFKAAIEADGKGDLISAYGQMQRDGTAYQTAIMERGPGLLGGTPWQYRDRYIENSPFFYFDRVETPLLIVHGSEDTGVASFLGDELFVALRRLGKDVEYAKYEGENHAPPYWSYPNQTDLCNRMIEWFSRYLGARH